MLYQIVCIAVRTLKQKLLSHLHASVLDRKPEKTGWSVLGRGALDILVPQLESVLCQRVCTVCVTSKVGE